MRACTFVVDGTVGTRKVRAGESVILPEAFVRALIRRGVATDQPRPAAPPEPVAEAQEERVQKSAPTLSKRALRKLLKRKAS